MHQWRVTKYDPRRRGPDGAFVGDDWTAASDIGGSFAGRVLTVAEYLAIEDKYVRAALHFAAEAGVDALAIVGLEEHGAQAADPTGGACLVDGLVLRDGDRVGGEALAQTCRLNLRALLWCKLEDARMFIHFGYDFYMYIGSIVPCPASIADARELGLFVEPMASPYS